MSTSLSFLHLVLLTKRGRMLPGSLLPNPQTPMFAAPSYGPESPIPRMSALRELAPGQSVHKLLDPPPPCFGRKPPPNLPCAGFEPMSTFCEGSTLNHGFCPEIAPATTGVTHPFVLHDVTKDDWKWFLYTVKISASLRPRDRVAAVVAPMVFGLHALGT